LKNKAITKILHKISHLRLYNYAFKFQIDKQLRLNLMLYKKYFSDSNLQLKI